MRMLIEVNGHYVVISDRIRWMEIHNQALRVCYDDGKIESHRAGSDEEIAGIRGLLDRSVEQDKLFIEWLKAAANSVA